ncbi:MAG: trypsin-like serine protease [Nannocystaceae bacterium]
MNPTQAIKRPLILSFRLTLAGLLGASLLGACDSGDDLDDDGQERAATTPDAMIRAADDAMLASLEYEPSPQKFEYIGRLDDGSAAAYLTRAAAEPPVRTPSGNDEDGGADLVDVFTRDGRAYRQRPGTEAHYTSRISRIGDEQIAPDQGNGEDTEGVDSLTFRELITDGVDNRSRTSTNNAQGVMVRIGSSSTSTGVRCSASMIAPRVFLTAAHCVTDSNGNVSFANADWVLPSARGRSYSGGNTAMDATDAPWGARYVTRVLRPVGWVSNRGPRFDYAVMIIGDHMPDTSGNVQWNPAPAVFSTNSCSELEGDGVNLRGYPGRTKTCADASTEDGTQCGGYAYTEHDPIQDCDDDAIYYDHDSQEGQSGSPVYRFDPATGIRNVVGINKGTASGGTRNYGHRIRTGSYGFICSAVEDPSNASSYFDNPSC